ncbi:hypothetical protein SEA_OCTOBIEN14_129 [Gordonia phage Octobien14]|uniref:Uncharacterized protein n=1 Tax=Gordonia phage Octobien14 TaxID=2483673 RepID=A0A3G3MBD0_9CAUD|nr:hypothetical protein L3Y22_gp115 [Gordonia phage Octobien14]AYR03264.1 hypothetical protein SEA_OCTOBIEN14_129 [Gordonia phage Octobien14]
MLVAFGILVSTVVILAKWVRTAQRMSAKPREDSGTQLMLETRSRRQIRRDAREYRAKYREFNRR